MRVCTTVKRKMSWLCLAAGLSLVGGCSGSNPHCRIDDASAAYGKWRYAGKVGASGTSSAAGVDRPAQIELRADGTFIAQYEAPFPSDVPGGTLSGTWSGGQRCAGLLYLSGTQVVTEPRIPRISVISVDDKGVLVLNGATAAFFDAQYERSDRPAAKAAAPAEKGSAAPPNEAASPDAAAPPAAMEAPATTPTPSGPRAKPTLYNPWHGRH
jgi:hypothetical protein